MPPTPSSRNLPSQLLRRRVIAVQPTDKDWFVENEVAFLALEELLSHKHRIDVAFAYAAECAEAGEKVGLSRVLDCLKEKLGIDWREACNRLAAGRLLFGARDESAPDPIPPDPKPLRKNVTQKKRDMLTREIDWLDITRKEHAPRLMQEGYEEASRRDLEDLTEWIRGQVRELNRDVKDPDFSWKNRSLNWTATDSHGGVRMSGYLPAESGALLESTLSPAQPPQQVDGKVDVRSLTQRRHDGFMELLRNRACHKAAHGGCVSLVLALTVEDLENIERYRAGGPGIATPEIMANMSVPLGLRAVLRLGLRPLPDNPYPTPASNATLRAAKYRGVRIGEGNRDGGVGAPAANAVWREKHSA